jgi:hypothetical protein
MYGLPSVAAEDAACVTMQKKFNAQQRNSNPALCADALISYVCGTWRHMQRHVRVRKDLRRTLCWFNVTDTRSCCCLDGSYQSRVWQSSGSATTKTISCASLEGVDMLHLGEFFLHQYITAVRTRPLHGCYSILRATCKAPSAIHISTSQQ